MLLKYAHKPPTVISLNAIYERVFARLNGVPSRCLATDRIVFASKVPRQPFIRSSDRVVLVRPPAGLFLKNEKGLFKKK